MLIIMVNPETRDEACWRYAYQVPTQEALDEVRAFMPGTFVTEVALVFFEGDHADLHKFFDAKFPGITDFDMPGRSHLSIVRDPASSGEEC